MIKKVSVHASRNYDILIGQNLITNTGEHLLQIHKPCKVLIVTDTTVDALYGEALQKSLADAGFKTKTYAFAPGESSKCLNTINDIVEILAASEFTRSDLIVALGGGIVGDVAGFAASIYQRGIEFVQIPTTLLAAVDSSVGGKTGVNLEVGKNMIGAFWQPSLVICDCNVFKTLPYEVFLDGIAEAIKYGCIMDNPLFDLLKAEGRNLYDTLSPSKYVNSNGPTGCTNTGIIMSSDEDIDPNSIVDLVDSVFASESRTEANTNNETLMQIIERCVQIKADIVAQDERDTGLRQLLNFGHTIGHAIEKASQFEITHGHAVAMGMRIISEACAKLGLCTEECAAEMTAILTEFGFDLECPHSSEALLEAALKDKKRAGQDITLVVPKEIGQCVLHKVPVTDLPKYFE